MKKTLSYISIIAASFMLGGCWSLDTTPHDSLSEDIFWNRASDIKKGVMGVYKSLKNNYCFGYDFMLDSVTDIAIGDYWQQFAIGTYSSTDGVVAGYWQHTYDLVQRANATMRSVSNAVVDETARGGIKAEDKAVAIAECKFLRALGYFRLTNLFGPVPYYDETWNLNATFDKMDLAPSSLEDIRGKIITDLTDAIRDLPEKWAASDYGRATQGAAYALRGKVYLYAKEWSKAIADFEKVVTGKDTYGYGLDPDYAHVFKVFDGDRSPEMVFSIQNSITDGMAMTSLMGNKASLRQIPTDRTVPSNELVDLYENLDGSKFNWNDYIPGWNEAEGNVNTRRDMVAVKINAEGKITDLLQSDTSAMAKAYRQRDPRLMAVAITPYSTYLGTTSGSIPQLMNFYICNTDLPEAGSPSEGIGLLRNNNVSWQPAYFTRKFVIEGNLGGKAGEYYNAPFEFPLIRYADILLMLAEAYNENGNLDKAVAEVNEVRARVGMPGLNSGPSWMTVSSKEEMSKRIRDERARELAFEGHRFFDIRRWGIGKSALNGREVKNIYGTRQYTQVYTDRDDLWPIPQSEKERNSALKDYQNAGW